MAKGTKRGTTRNLFQELSAGVGAMRDHREGRLELRRHQVEPTKVYQLKVTLMDTHPPIWRRLRVPDRRGATATAHIEGEALRVGAAAREERQQLLPHRAALNALDAPYLDVQEHSETTAREIPHPPALPVVEAPARATTRARCFFGRR